MNKTGGGPGSNQYGPKGQGKRKDQEREEIERAPVPAVTSAAQGSAPRFVPSESVALSLHDFEVYSQDLLTYLGEGEMSFFSSRKNLHAMEAVLDRLATIGHYLDEKGMREVEPEVDWSGLWGVHVAITKAYRKSTPEKVWATANEIAEEVLPRLSPHFEIANEVIAELSERQRNEVFDADQAKPRSFKDAPRRRRG